MNNSENKPTKYPPNRPHFRTVDFVLNGFVTTLLVVLFFAAGYFAIRRFLEHSWMTAFWLALVSFCCIPMVDTRVSYRARIARLPIVPFVMAGLALSVFVYFQLFYFDWFENVFNGKGSGPLGLILFACCGLAAGGLAGYWCMKRLYPDCFDRYPSEDPKD